MKRVASAVGDGSVVIHQVHEYLAGAAEPRDAARWASEATRRTLEHRA